MITTNDIVSSAEKWIDTPFCHQGRKIGVGVDCIGLAIGIALDVGLITKKEYSKFPVNYPMKPNPRMLSEYLDRYMDKVNSCKVADWLWMGNIGQPPIHVAMCMGGDTYIHAFQDIGKVALFKRRKAHSRLIKGIYSYRGIVRG